MGVLMTSWWPASKTRVALVLLAVVVACPLMVTVAAMPAASSCHDRPGQDHDGNTSAFSCCATVATEAGVRTAPETDTHVSSPVAYEPSPVRSIGRSTAPLRARPPTLPLFLQHASFLI